MADTDFHAGDQNIGLDRRPAVQENSAVIDPVPVGDFLFTDVRRKLRVLAQTLKVSALYT